MRIIQLHFAVAIVGLNGNTELSVISGKNGVGNVRKRQIRSSLIRISRRIIAVSHVGRTGMGKRERKNGVRGVEGGRQLSKLMTRRIRRWWNRLKRKTRRKENQVTRKGNRRDRTSERLRGKKPIMPSVDS